MRPRTARSALASFGAGARPWLAVIAAALVLASCGTRVPEDEVRAALASARSGAPVGDDMQEAAPMPGESAGDRPGPDEPDSGDGEPRGETVATGDASPGGPASGGPAPTAPGERSPSGCSGTGGATDTGVTATSIAVGATYAESSLIPGQFRPAVDAVAAYLDMVNRERGGVCGRRIDFHVHNDGLNAQRYGENVRHLAEEDRVFAMLGNLSAADSGGCGFMDGQRPPDGVPDIGTFALSYCRSQDDGFYSPMGSLKPGIYGCCVDWEWLEERTGLTTPAVHYLDVEISRDQGLAVADALARTLGLGGRDDVYRGEHSAAQFSYAGDVQDMQDAGVDAVWSSMDLNGNVKLVRAMCQQEWYPKVVHVEISSYDPQFIERVGPDCVRSQHIWMRSPHLPFTSPNDEVRSYLDHLRNYCPGCRPSSFGLEGWLSAKLFVEVLEEVGPELTRRRFFEAMDAVRDWTGGGTIGPNTPSRRLIYHCNVLVEVRPAGFFMERGWGCGKFYASGDVTGPPVGP